MTNAFADAIKATNSDPDCCPIPPSKIQKSTILPADFGVEAEKLTPTSKQKRSIAEAKYGESHGL